MLNSDRKARNDLENRPNLESVVLELYDPTYLGDVIRETYRLYYTYAVQHKKEDLVESIQREYTTLTSELSLVINSVLDSRPLDVYDVEGTLLGTWVDRINTQYQNLTGKDGKEIDPLYDPRSLFKNLSTFLREKFSEEYPRLNAVLGLLEKPGAKHLGSHLKELDESGHKTRIENWHRSLPQGTESIVSEGDLSDVSYLGSKAMANAFLFYFTHHCLSGSLGSASMLPAADVYAPTFEQVDIDHVATFVRISERVLAKYLLTKARESEYQINDSRFWDDIRDELNERRRASESDLEGKIDLGIKRQLEFLHKRMIDYVDRASSLDFSVLDIERSGMVPLVSQVDAVLLLRAEKANGSRGRAIIAHGMGSGKTYPSIWADALYRKEGLVKKTLILCENNMKETWARRYHDLENPKESSLTEEAFRELYPNGIKIVSGKESLKEIEGASVVIANYEMVYRSLQYQVEGDNTVIETVEDILNNGADGSLMDQDFITELKRLADSYHNNSLERTSIHFKGREKVVDWIGEDKVKASYALAADELIANSLAETQSLFTYGADFILLDEGHIVKNPSAKTTEAVVKLAENIPRLALLTGTLMPNRWEDVTIPLSLMDPEFNLDSLNGRGILEPKIRAIRQALIPYLSRFTREDISPRNYSVTPEHERTIEVKTDEVMSAVYRAILRDSSQNYAQKVKLARLATLHPAFAINKIWQMAERGNGMVNAEAMLEDILDNVSDETWSRVESGLYVPPKYLKLAEIVGNTDEDMLVFTSIIEGNTRLPLDSLVPIITVDRYIASQFQSENCIVLVHDGRTKSHHDPEKSERRQVLNQFEGPHRVILFPSYGTLSQGYDLSKATCAVALDLNFSIPEQAIGRSDRLTQKKDVTVKYLIVVDETLSAGTKSGLTIDQSEHLLGLDKQTVSGITLDGNPPNESELQAYRTLCQKEGGMPHNYTPIRDSLVLEPEEEKSSDLSEREKLHSFIRSTKNLRRGSRNNVERFEDALQDAFIRNGVLDKTSYAYKSNQMIGTLLNGLEGIAICDVGGGPAMLYFNGGLSAYNIVDPINWQRAIARVMGEDVLPKDVEFIQKYLSEFAEQHPEAYNLIVANNMLHWTSVIGSQGRPCEREQFLRDANRTLPKDGKLVIGLPGSYSDAALENIELSLEHTGFGDISTHQLNGVVDKSFYELLAIARKTHEPSKKMLSPAHFNYSTSSGRVERSLGRTAYTSSSEYSRPVETSFVDADGFTVSELGELLL